MRTEEIEQRIKDIKNEIHSLDSLKESNDDVNIHVIEEQISSLEVEKFNLQDMLERCFDELIGL